jgi:hypothetical protein
MATSPRWDSRKLIRHHRKRTTGKDAGCFEDLLGIVGRAMSELEYVDRSEAAVTNAWGQYRGEGRDIASGEYNEERTYFVDDQLVVAITDASESDFITCFHEHFSRPHASPSGAVGQRRLRYKEHLRFDEQAGLIRNVRRVRGV